MGRKEIGLWTGVVFLWALLAVLATVEQGMERSFREKAEVRALELRMEAMEEETVEKQLKIAKWYNLQLEQGNYVPEWDYKSILNLGEGRMGLLSVPDWEMKLPITHGIGGVAGHDQSTALPTGGREEQTVLYLEKAVPWQEGMTVRTALPGAEQEWQVVSVQVMSPGWPVEHPAGSALLTLVQDTNSTRTIVRCRPGQGSPREKPDVGSLGRKAFFWGVSPLFLIPALCTLGKFLYFLHPWAGERLETCRKLWNTPEKPPKSVFAKILRL